MADALQNPVLLQGLMQMQQPNKFIDPQYQNNPLPMPSFYMGNSGNAGSMPPTDAMGNPIQSFVDAQKAHDAWQPPAAPAQGTTLNSTGTYGLQPSQLAGPSALNPSGNQAFGMSEWGGMMSPQARDLYKNQQFAPPGSERGQTYANMGQPGGDGTGSGAAPAAATNPIDMRQAYLNALSNPGKVNTPGATVPASSPLGQPSVLDSFMAANQHNPNNNQGFFNTLNKLQGAKGVV